MSTLTFQGAVKEVTGSRYLIEMDGDGLSRKLVREGFSWPNHCTRGTFDLLDINTCNLKK